MDSLAFIAGLSRADYLLDKKTQAATVMMLIVIGEAAVRVTDGFPDFVAEHPDWPWVQMRAMRNRGAHAYDTIVFEVIWDTLERQIPPLLRHLQNIGPLNP